MGISVLTASPDEGSSGCLEQHTTSQLPLPQLTVDYPASSKWVTAVGGTNVQLNTDNTIATQEVWNDEDDFGSPQRAADRRQRRRLQRPVPASELPERDNQPESAGGARRRAIVCH